MKNCQDKQIWAHLTNNTHWCVQGCQIRHLNLLKLILKVPDLSHLGPIWPNLDAKFDIPGLRCVFLAKTAPHETNLSLLFNSFSTFWLFKSPRFALFDANFVVCWTNLTTLEFLQLKYLWIMSQICLVLTQLWAKLAYFEAICHAC